MSGIGRQTVDMFADAVRSIPFFEDDVSVKKVDEGSTSGQYHWWAEFEVMYHDRYTFRLTMRYTGQADTHEEETTVWGVKVIDRNDNWGSASLTKPHYDRRGEKQSDRIGRDEMYDLVEEAWRLFKRDKGITSREANSRCKKCGRKF